MTDGSIKPTLHVAVSAEATLDMAPPPLLGPQLHRLEPLHVLAVEEHEANSEDTLVDLERVTREHRPLHHDPAE